MKRADFEAMVSRTNVGRLAGKDLHLVIAREIDRAVRKARKEEREKARKELERLHELASEMLYFAPTDSQWPDRFWPKSIGTVAKRAEFRRLLGM